MTNVSNFLRGVIDGDGSIKGRAGNTMITIASGSIGFLNDLKLLLNRLDISSGKILFDKKSKCKYFSITKISNLVKLYNLIYNHTSRFHYKRKRLTLKNNIFKYLNE